MAVQYHFPRKASRKALVAVEDPQALKYLREALSRAGYASVPCSDVRHILDPRRTAGHAFVILNDGASRREVVKQLRNEKASIPAILLSGSPEQADDCAVHLSTPYTMQTLEAAIARVCPAFPGLERS